MKWICACVAVFLICGGVAAHGPEASVGDQDGTGEAAAAVLPPGGYQRAVHELIKSRQAGRGDANGWERFDEAYRTLQQIATQPPFAEDALLTEFLEEERVLDAPLPRAHMLLHVASDTLERPDLMPLAEKFVAAAEDAGVFQGIVAAAAAPRAIAPQPDDWLLNWTGHAHLVRTLTWACEARALVARRQGSEDPAELVLQLQSIARVATEQGFRMEYLVGLRASLRASEAVIVFIMSGEADEELCLQLLEVLGEEAPVAPLTFAIEVVRLETFDLIDYFYQQVIEEVTEGMPEEEAARRGAAMREHGTGVFGSQAAQNAKAEEYFGPALELAALSYHERVASSARLPRGFFDDMPMAYRPLEMSLPALGIFFERYSGVMLTHAGARVMLALELHRARHGGYPEALADLVPEILPELPEDPFSADGLRYRRIDPSEDPLGRGYLLYSVGTDGEDHGGIEREQDPTRALRAARAALGFDYVINRRR